MVTPITKLFHKECEKTPAAEIAAYTEHYLDEENPTHLILDTSWDKSTVDLAPAIKAGETLTRLYLAPESGEPEGLCYEREDGGTDYISGDALSRAISLHLLKDVDQSTPPSNGIVYMYNESTGLFEAYDLSTFVGNTNASIGKLNALAANLQNQITALQTQITSLQNQINTLNTKVDNEIARAQAAERTLGDRLTAIENAIYNWSSDKTTKIARGNINVTSGGPTSGNGIYTRTPNTNNDIDFQ